MGFLAPLALLFAALSVPIILLYMLKLRRRDVLVSSTLLWQRLLRDREANAPWQRLRRNLLLLLQLLILALLAVALARPFFPVETVVTGNVVVLLDGSASMQARDVPPTRFEAARRAVRDIFGGLGANDAATLIAVGPQPQVLASATVDRALLRRALDGAAPTDGAADWEAAFALAVAGLAGAVDTQVVIVSDGALPPSLPSLPGEARFVGVGGGSDNRAITALATREGATGPQAFLRVANFGDADAQVLVQFTADGALFDARRMSIPAGGSADVTLTDLPYDLQVLQAQLDGEDALPLDDVAWAVHAPPVSGRVLLVSTGNLFLERALGAIPGLELVRLTPDAPLPEEPYDLLVYDRVVSGTVPVGNAWFIGPTVAEGADAPITSSGYFSATEISRVAADDPLLRYVDLNSVHVLRARAVPPPPGARVLVEAPGGPLLMVAESPQGRLAVLTFALHDSDLPLQVAFPILTSNLVEWLLPQGAMALPALVHPGDPVPLQPDPEAARVRVTAPGGDRQALDVDQQVPVFAATDRLGVYWVEQLDREGNTLQTAALAVNLFDEGESNVAPRQTVQIGQTEVETAVEQEEGRREFWPWLAFAALGVLAAEWWTYYRGTR